MTAISCFFGSVPYPFLLPGLCAQDTKEPTASWTETIHSQPNKGSGRTVSNPQHGTWWSHPSFYNNHTAVTTTEKIIKLAQETISLHTMSLSQLLSIKWFLVHLLYPWDDRFIHVYQLFSFAPLHPFWPYCTPVVNPKAPCIKRSKHYGKTAQSCCNGSKIKVIVSVPLSSKRHAGLMGSEKPMEDRSSFPANGSEEVDGSRLGRWEEGPKHRSSLCPWRLLSTQLQSAQALTISLNTPYKIGSHLLQP